MLLPFQSTIVEDLTRDHGLLVMAKGLGLEKIVTTIINIHSDPRNLVLLLNVNSTEVEIMKRALNDARIGGLTKGLEVQPECLKVINNECNAKERAEVYLQGGVLAVTSRILVVDLLNKIVPIELVAGILINQAHYVTDTSPISFILRLYRQGNKNGFVTAFSDHPDLFCGQLTKLERMMKILQVRSMHLWPRFQMTVRSDLEERGSIELIELRIPMTRAMKLIQASLMECLNQMLLELKRLHPFIDSEEIKLENSFSKSFDTIVRNQLESVWQRSSLKTKQIVNDLKSVRLLLRYLVQYDSVTFYTFLETEKLSASKTFSWLQLDAADIVYSQARQRVYCRAPDALPNPRLPAGFKATTEVQPKWRGLIETLQEIEAERVTGSVLVVCKGGRTADQLRNIIHQTDLKANKYNPKGSESLLLNHLYKYFEWKGGMFNASTREVAPNPPASNQPPNKRRRVREKPVTVQEPTFQEEAKQIAEFIATSAPLAADQNPSNSHIKVRAYSGYMGGDEPDFTILDYIEPLWIVMYDPDISFVRRIEVYKALNPHLKIKVFFFVYDNSSEEQEYLTNLRREKDSFEKLILQKSHVAIPINEHGLADSGMFKDVVVEQKSILVDVREFRSSLPLMIHSRRISIIPCTIEVGDYILSDKICVERKSPSDLAQSLKSGRLYKQCQAMTLHYPKAVLLIEYPQHNAFQLTFSGFDGDFEVTKRLALLILHFPKLGIIWSSSPAATAEIFEDLQVGQENPSMERAQKCGVESKDTMETATNQTPSEMLLAIPGITFRNYMTVMKNVKNIRALSDLTEAEIAVLVGVEAARLVYNFFHDTITTGW